MFKILKITKTKFLTLVSLVCIAPALTLSVAYASSTTSTTPGSNTAAAKNLVSTVITKGNTEIERRLKTLPKLSAKINNSKKMASADKTALTSEVNNEVSGLTTLKGTLDACTTTACAKSAAQSIFSEYRVYLLVVPQVNMIKTADDQQTAQAKLSDLASKLTTRLSSSSKSTSDLQTDLTTMKSDISSATQQSKAVETSVEALTPANFNNNHDILVQYYNDLKTAQSDDQAASAQAKTIIQALGGSGSKTTGSKTTGSKTN